MKLAQKSFIFLLAIIFNCQSVVYADRNMYQLSRFEINELILIKTKRVHGKWLACIKPLGEQKPLLATKGQGFGMDHGMIDKIDRHGIVVGEFRMVNDGEWILHSFRIPLVKDRNYSNIECDWDSKNIQKITPPSYDPEDPAINDD
ncbi:MAG: hypothetical protein LBE62_05185 [Azonexus sp.]|nr:hypothetical protein [Azonexus sp.]